MAECGARYEWLAKSSPPYICNLSEGHEGEHIEDSWVAWPEWKPHWSVARLLTAGVYIALGIWLALHGINGPSNAEPLFGTLAGWSLGLAVMTLVWPKFNRPRPRVLSLREHWTLKPPEHFDVA